MSGKVPGELVRVRPVNLTIGLQVVLGVLGKCPSLVGPHKPVEPRPVLLGERLGMFGDGHVRRGPLVTWKNSCVRLRCSLQVSTVLAVAKDKPLLESLL